MDGYYINLDRSPERRSAMEAQLAGLGMSWVTRFAAIDGARVAPPAHCGISAGEFACFASHAQVITAPSPGGFRLVLEDDVEIARDLPAIVQGFGLAQLEAYDLIFLDCQPQLNATAIMTLWNCLRTHRVDATAGRVSGANIYNADDIYHFGATAYLVTPAGRSRLAGLLQRTIDTGPALPIDLWFAQMSHQKQLKIAVIAPFLVTPGLESYAASTLSERPAPPPEMIGMNSLRRMFFAGPWQPVEAYSQAWRQQHDSADPQLNLLTALFMKLTARGFVAEASLGVKSDIA